MENFQRNLKLFLDSTKFDVLILHNRFSFRLSRWRSGEGRRGGDEAQAFVSGYPVTKCGSDMEGIHPWIGSKRGGGCTVRENGAGRRSGSGRRAQPGREGEEGICSRRVGGSRVPLWPVHASRGPCRSAPRKTPRSKGPQAIQFVSSSPTFRN